MGLTWMNNGFICKDLYAPFVLDKDSDYHDDLKKKYKIVLKQKYVNRTVLRKHNLNDENMKDAKYVSSYEKVEY